MDSSMEELPLFSQEQTETEQDASAASRLTGKTGLAAAVKAWGEALDQMGRSVHTVKAFTGDLRIMARYVGAGQPVDQIGTHDIKHFLDWMLNHRNVPCSPKTYARRITSIKSFFRWLVDEGVLETDPADPVPQQTVISPLPDVLTPAEVERVLHTADTWRQSDNPDARPYVLVKLLLDTGVKKGECLNIHLNHIDLDASQGPTLFIRYARAKKRYKERKLSLTPEWVHAYQEYLRQYEPDERLFPWSPRRLEYLLEEIGEAANLDKHLSFDMCRWTASLRDFRQEREDQKIRQKLGISEIQWREVGKKIRRLAEKEGWQPVTTPKNKTS
ncbi:MAG: phage integrase N-terminal SAM-like domain-containing protein [Anaerolineales bacterium]|jgi:integrase/recombinase XerD